MTPDMDTGAGNRQPSRPEEPGDHGAISPEDRADGDHEPGGADGRHAKGTEDDGRPRRGPVLLAALMVPLVGVVFGRPAHFLAAVAASGGVLRLAAMAAVLVVVFIALTLAAAWAVNTAAALIHRLRERRAARYGGPA